MITAVLDANTLISAVLVALGISRQILRAAYDRRFTCVSSTPIVAEVLRAFGRPRISRKYSVPAHEIEELRRFLESDLVSVPLTVEVHGVATHPEDDLILATALSAQADYLVTGDRGLLNIGTFRGVTIVTPRRFLGILVDTGAVNP